ncbi:MAG: class I SAM-dependent methyltransferase, partial [Planctomycetes bacterium]|nr:class I SAM-dependent methyltransferase [Planctomycetota bacterium]
GRHPWFYRKMIGKPETPLPAGTPAKVRDRDGRLVGTGFYNPRAELALRMFSDGVVEDAKAHFVEALRLAVQLREQTLGLPKITDAYRLIHAEGDGFPGLVLDRLGNAIVAQVASLGMKEQLEPLGEWLLRHYQNSRLVLLQDKDWTEREGMDKLPRPNPVATTVHEHGVRYAVQAGTGHKTGFFADQRDNRLLVRTLAKGRSVLDLCCNSGGFAMNAVLGGARSVLAGDLDEAMVEATLANAKTNKLRL